MNGQGQLDKRLLWALTVINALGGVVGLLVAFGEGGIDWRWLAIGVVSLVASVAWFLNLRRS